MHRAGMRTQQRHDAWHSLSSRAMSTQLAVSATCSMAEHELQGLRNTKQTWQPAAGRPPVPGALYCSDSRPAKRYRCGCRAVLLMATSSDSHSVRLAQRGVTPSRPCAPSVPHHRHASPLCRGRGVMGRPTTAPALATTSAVLSLLIAHAKESERVKRFMFAAGLQDEDVASVSAGAQRALPAEVEVLAGGFTDSALSLSDSAGLGWWRYQGLRL